MSLHLIGGGAIDAATLAAFVDECAARATAAGRGTPRIAVLVVGGNAVEHATDLRACLDGVRGDRPGELEIIATVLDEGDRAELAALVDADGVLIGGGRIPAVRESLEPLFGELRRLVASGVPFAGFSAGAAIAAESALIGGHSIGGVAVAPDDASEDLDEVTVAPGIGLVDVSIDVHAAQWGTVSRLIAAVEAGIAAGGLAIDEHTVLIVGDGGLRVDGRGSVWRVLPGEQGVVVSTIGA